MFSFLPVHFWQIHLDLFQDAKMWGLQSIPSIMEACCLPQCIWKRQMFLTVWAERELLQFLQDVFAVLGNELSFSVDSMGICASFSISQISAVQWLLSWNERLLLKSSAKIYKILLAIGCGIKFLKSSWK